MTIVLRPAWVAGLVGVVVSAAVGRAQKPAPPAEPASAATQDLAKSLSNPVSSLVSVPFQFNWEQKVGPDDQTRFILNVQPVMPFTLNRDWNLIVRMILPFVSQPPLVSGGDPSFGTGDILTSLFLSPSSGRITWALGPAISLPSTATPTLGTEKWSAGPTAIVLTQGSGWTVGALANQVWSFAGNSRRAAVNQLFLQPFIAYQASRTITLTVQSETTANWEASDDRWTVPINVSVAKLSSFGEFPASYQIGGGVFVAHPDLGPTWKLRSAIVLLMPRKK